MMKKGVKILIFSFLLLLFQGILDVKAFSYQVEYNFGHSFYKKGSDTEGNWYDDEYLKEPITKFIYRVHDGSDATDFFCIDQNLPEPKIVNTKEELGDSQWAKALKVIYRMYQLHYYGKGDKYFLATNDAMRVLSTATGNRTEGYNTTRVDAAIAAAEGMSNGPDADGKIKGIKDSTKEAYKPMEKMFCVAAVLANYSYGAGEGCQKVFNDYKEEMGGNVDFLTKKVNRVLSFSPEGDPVDTGNKTNSYSKIFTIKPKGKDYELIKQLISKSSLLKSNSSIKLKSVSCPNTGYTCTLKNPGVNILSDDFESFEIIVERNTTIMTKEVELDVKLNYTYDFPYDDNEFYYYYNKNKISQRLLKAVSKSVEVTNVIIKDVIVPATCEEKIVKGNNEFYVDQKKVSFIEYLKAGCCPNPASVPDEGKEDYKSYSEQCLADDLVYLDASCNGSSDNNMCENPATNDPAVDYTHSYVYQVPINTIKKKIESAEAAGQDAKNLLPNYLDPDYVSDVGNEYCMAYTSEYNDIYLPGTAVGTSGRYFVFSSENCGGGKGICYRQPYINGSIEVLYHTDIDKWVKDYESLVNALGSAVRSANDTWTCSQRNIDSYCKECNYCQTGTDEETGEAIYNTSCSKCGSYIDQTCEAEIWSCRASVSDGTPQKSIDKALDNITDHQKKKEKCEALTDIKSKWKYDFDPDVSFSYDQVYYDGKTSKSTTEISMISNTEKVKYYENVTTNATCDWVENKKTTGTIASKTFSGHYSATSPAYSYDATKNYSMECSKTVYYRPEKKYYSLIPTGLYITSYDENSTIDVGYVYNISLTTYEGQYDTKYNVTNLGHHGNTSKNSNVENSVDAYLSDHHIDEFASSCYYCAREEMTTRECDTCTPTPNLFYRSVSLSDVTPSDRANTNWSDEKGITTEERIEKNSGENISAQAEAKYQQLGATYEELPKATFLSDNSDVKVKLVANDIYDDSSKEFLEYEFTLTTTDMQQIRKNTEKLYDYGTFTSCGNNPSREKGNDVEYCFVCHNGKECESTFIDAYSNMDITNDTRVNKWKYFYYDKTKRQGTILEGNWNSLVKSGFFTKSYYQDYINASGDKYLEADAESGLYPNPEAQDIYLSIYKNWP